MRARRAATPRGSTRASWRRSTPGAGTGFTTEGIVERVDAGARDDARPEPAPARARAQRKPGARRVPAAARRRRGAAVRRRSRSTATCRRAASSTGPTRSAAIAEAYRVLRPGGVGAGDRPGAAGAGGSRAGSRTLWMLFPERGRSTARGSSGPASTTSRCIRWRPTGTATRRAPYAVAVAGTKPAAGPSPLALAPAPAEDAAGAAGAAAPRRASRRASSPARSRALAFVPIAPAMTLRARLERR